VDSFSSDMERKLYYDGIELFNHHEFFEAHEFWEDIWRMAYGVKHDFYQGIIQCAVALEHYNRSNPRGVISLFESYQKKFIHVPPIFMGLDVKPFLSKMHEVLRPVVEANPIPQRGEITLDHSQAPRFELLYDPFETGEAAKFDRPQAL